MLRIVYELPAKSRTPAWIPSARRRTAPTGPDVHGERQKWVTLPAYCLALRAALRAFSSRNGGPSGRLRVGDRETSRGQQLSRETTCRRSRQRNSPSMPLVDWAMIGPRSARRTSSSRSMRSVIASDVEASGDRVYVDALDDALDVEPVPSSLDRPARRRHSRHLRLTTSSTRCAGRSR